MASITTVEDDIALEIGLYLLDDKQSLCALTRTNRRNYNLVRGLLVTYIEIWVLGPSSVENERCDQLLRTLNYHPDLAVHTRSIRLKWSCDSPWVHVDRNAANSRADNLLRLIPNIRSLDIQNNSYKCSPFAPPLPLLLKLTQLSEVTTSDPKCTAYEVAQFMQLPNIQELTVHFMDVQSRIHGLNSAKQDDGASRSRLTRLALPKDSHLPPSELRFLLTVSSSITMLSCNIPGLEPREQAMRRSRARAALMRDVLSPARSLESLSPVRGTLVELDLIDAGVGWPGHDASRLDLSGFERLKRLSLSAACLFVPHGSWGGRKGLWQLLPKTAEKIHVNLKLSRRAATHSSDLQLTLLRLISVSYKASCTRPPRFPLSLRALPTLHIQRRRSTQSATAGLRSLWIMLHTCQSCNTYRSRSV